LRNPAILSVSASSNIPAVTGSNLSNIKIEDGIQVNIPFISIDADFTNNLGIKLLEGRDFKSGPQSDSRSAFLLNKTAIEQLGIKNPVGKNIILYRDQNGISIPYWSGQIIGVVNDYAYRPAYDQSSGVLFCNDPGRFNAMFIRINSDKQNESISFVKQTWEKMFSDIPFSADFLEDEIENDIVIQLFYTVQKFIIAAAIFSFILALLGLFGLSIISATQKVKEIGIRRVNGASVGKILVLMNRKFIEMVLLSFAISIPIVYFMAEEVKKEQANSTNLSIQNYGIAFLLILIISFSVVSWQGWKTAKRNPVETLRYE
jgi:putative ABC transport system permease protein